MATFEVREVFRLPSLGVFVLAGNVKEGSVKLGMKAMVPLHGEMLAWSLRVKSVEFLDRLSVGETLVALVCAETTTDDAEACAELCPPGTVIQVQEVSD